VKRIFIGIIFAIAYLCQGFVLFAAGPAEIRPLSDTITSNGERVRADIPESIQGLEVFSDSFGGYIYYYKDRDGNRFATNDLASISERIVLADAGGSEQNEDVLERNEVEADSRLFEAEEDEDYYDPLEDEDAYETVSDPLEPLNRVFFYFNDKLYFWFLKPVASGYGAVVPKPARVSVKNFFKNLGFPIRFVNCLLQAKFESAGDEFSRFMVNTIIGLGGFFDPATSNFGLKRQEEDFGQTLGVYGFGPALYINWPILGPSSIRDTVGLAGDSFLDPMGYICSSSECNMAVTGYKTVNNTSLRIGDYEDLKDAALDPYLAVRDAYFQYRRNKVKK